MSLCQLAEFLYKQKGSCHFTVLQEQLPSQKVSIQPLPAFPGKQKRILSHKHKFLLRFCKEHSRRKTKNVETDNNLFSCLLFSFVIIKYVLLDNKKGTIACIVYDASLVIKYARHKTKNYVAAVVKSLKNDHVER